MYSNCNTRVLSNLDTLLFSLITTGFRSKNACPEKPLDTSSDYFSVISIICLHSRGYRRFLLYFRTLVVSTLAKRYYRLVFCFVYFLWWNWGLVVSYIICKRRRPDLGQAMILLWVSCFGMISDLHERSKLELKMLKMEVVHVCCIE